MNMEGIELTDLKNDSTTLMKKITSTIANILANNAKFKKDKAEIISSLNKILDKIKLLKKIMLELETTKQSNQKTIEELQNKIRENEASITILTSETLPNDEKIQKEIEELNNKNRRSEQTIQMLNMEISNLTNKISNYEDRLNEFNQSLSQLTIEDYNIDDIKKLVNEIDELLPEKNSVESVGKQVMTSQILRDQLRDNIDSRTNTYESKSDTTRVGGRKLKRSSTKKSNKKSKKNSKKKSKKLKGGYLYRKRNKYQTLSSTRKSKPSKSKRKYFKY